jgi:threonine-phosphate decarboxylase
MNIKDAVRKDIQFIGDTVHGGQAWKLKNVEDFSHNLNPSGPPNDLYKIVFDAISGTDHYPDDNSTELKKILADHFKVGVENIIVGAGSSDLIRMFPNTFIEKGEKALIMRPSFAEYSHQCRIAGAIVKELPLKESNDLRIDADELLTNTDDVKAVYICNPNNPTGRAEPREKILKIVKECNLRGILVFLDETLLELVHDHDKITCSEYVKEYNNLLVIGSLTKSFAIPGIRIGFGIAGEEIIKAMDKVRMSWNVGNIEQHVAACLIRDHMDHVKNAAKMMFGEAEYVCNELNKIGFKVCRTDSFFFFESLKDIGMKVPEFKEKMLAENIMVRDCGSFGQEFKDHIRFCVKDRERNDIFINAVKKVMNGVN